MYSDTVMNIWKQTNMKRTHTHTHTHNRTVIKTWIQTDIILAGIYNGGS